MSLFRKKSAAFRAAAKSRRSRLLSLDRGSLMWVVRRELFGRGRWTAARLVQVVRHCAERRCDEAKWLLSKIEGLPLGGHFVDFQKRVAQSLAGDDSPMALFYRSRLSEDPPESEARKTKVERAARGGFAPAMTFLAQWLSEDERLVWLRKAAALHDPNALYLLTDETIDEPTRLSLNVEAASRGNLASMYWLSTEVNETLVQPMQRALWRVRSAFQCGDFYGFTPEVHDAVERMKVEGRWSSSDVRFVHAVGREQEGIEQLWEGMKPDNDHSKCVDFYLLIMHSARRAALQTVVSMRQRGLPRDVAIVIARFVYSSRDDAVAWCLVARKNE